MNLQKGPPPSQKPKTFGDFSSFGELADSKSLGKKLAVKPYQPGAAKQVDFSTPNLGNHCILILATLTLTIIILLSSGVFGTASKNSEYTVCPVQTRSRCNTLYQTHVYYQELRFTQGMSPEECIPLCGQFAKAKAIEVTRRSNDLRCHCKDSCLSTNGSINSWTISLRQDCSFQK
ncbi:hypothetical protein TCAL_03889 [Tigriopus californicus]|uniref:Uncharacterized protein n=1 Tax=Tigriopus californicus TaxID=6832 RepID=A0A553NBN1_TIGCA|nr:uncharacterized protein LOC131888170 [Tigriopus californicus]TRY62856.1 hypothetical protein TCAL_03889 [Tigriopus californicus]